MSLKEGIAGVVLAGGQGRRMGGEDKGLIALAGRPLISYVINRITPQVESVSINSRSCSDYQSLNLPCFADQLTGGLGPLAGLHSALLHSHHQWVISLPCDTPMLPNDLVARMFQQIQQQSGAKLCTVADHTHTHATILLAHHTLAPSIESYLNSGKRRIIDWFEQQHGVVVNFADQADAFVNINTPQQLAELERTLCL